MIVCFPLSNSNIKVLHVAASSCGRGSFRKRSSCGRGYFFIRIKKMRFQKYPDTCGRGLNYWENKDSTSVDNFTFLLGNLKTFARFLLLSFITQHHLSNG